MNQEEIIYQIAMRCSKCNNRESLIVSQSLIDKSLGDNTKCSVPICKEGLMFVTGVPSIFGGN